MTYYFYKNKRKKKKEKLAIKKLYYQLFCELTYLSKPNSEILVNVYEISIGEKDASSQLNELYF